MRSVPNHPRTSTAVRWLSLLGRVALSGLSLWLLLGVLQLVARLNYSSAERGRLVSESAEIHWNELLDGAWQLQGAPWQVSTSQVEGSLVDARLREPPVDRPGDGASQPSSAAAIIRFIRSTKAVPVGLDPYLRYETQTAVGRIVAFTSIRDGAEQVVSLRIALKASEFVWRVIEVCPAPSTLLASATGDHLLSLPPGTQCLARRYDRHGRTLAEIVSGSFEPQAMTEAWLAAGWRILDSRQVHACRQFECHRGGRACTVWLMPGPDHQQIAFIVATLASEDG